MVDWDHAIKSAPIPMGPSYVVVYLDIYRQDIIAMVRFQILYLRTT